MYAIFSVLRYGYWIKLFHVILFLLLQLTAEQCKLLLIQAICSILKKCKDDKFRIVTLPDEDSVPSSAVASAPVPVPESESSQVPAESSTSTEPSANVNMNGKKYFFCLFICFIRENLRNSRFHQVKEPSNGFRMNSMNVCQFSHSIISKKWNDFTRTTTTFWLAAMVFWNSCTQFYWRRYVITIRFISYFFKTIYLDCV